MWTDVSQVNIIIQINFLKNDGIIRLIGRMEKKTYK